ncbi:MULTISPECIES: plasmid SOS inhibition protein A [Pantoea]|uniref:plasmid SOS inhibition protein A n=1 Tax=Pantoea TaxID=53335 RepID=UPI0019820E24|nr:MULTISPECIES: plasmid SOS inhibition protein A [Pantoea]WRH15731.1 plasmid SOS inhibition protein A [Pantoea sp. JZ2]
MIPNNRSLVPLSRERQAAIQAIMYVEQKAGRRLYCAEYPYARAYFRFLMGSKRITLKEIRVFCPCLQESELRGRKQAWLKAIDILIASEGGCCPLPLSCNDAGWVFPEKRFQQTERRRMKRELHAEKYSRQRQRERQGRERAYLAEKGQAEIDLAFHTPETVSCWVSRWSESGVTQYDLETLFFRWSERFPSMKGLERWMTEGQPLWKIGAEARHMSAEATEAVRELERWMVPNKLTQGRLLP